MMEKSSKKLYAIGFRRWVELRSALAPPRIEVSQVEKPLKIRVWEEPTAAEYTRFYSQARAYYARERRTCPKYPKGKFIDKSIKFTLKSVVYIGGRPIVTVNSRRFARWVRNVKNGEMLKLNDKNIKVLILKGFTKLNKYINSNGGTV
jgi:hypothetical protein